jgi:hypothetical protein
MRRPFGKPQVIAVVAAAVLGALIPSVASAQCYSYDTSYDTTYYGTNLVPYTYSSAVVVPNRVRYYDYDSPRLLDVGVPGIAHVGVGGRHLLHVGAFPGVHFSLF